MFPFEEYTVFGKDGRGVEGRKLRVIENKEGLPWTVSPALTQWKKPLRILIPQDNRCGSVLVRRFDVCSSREICHFIWYSRNAREDGRIWHGQYRRRTIISSIILAWRS
jgi:hypothetical protein